MIATQLLYQSGFYQVFTYIRSNHAYVGAELTSHDTASDRLISQAHTEY